MAADTAFARQADRAIAFAVTPRGQVIGAINVSGRSDDDGRGCAAAVMTAIFP